ncbi:methanol--corrinoid protein MtaC [Methanolobus sp. WCC4]|uniref:methanol--corrinoid protein MtaC n=1 Tax=Methanolobus sp. WCC4 TaxID=3125784 RepID=UPI0030F90EC3
MLDIDPTGIVVRYNVILERELTPDEIARELFPSDILLRNIVESVYEGDEDEVIIALKEAVNAGKDPFDLIDDALIRGMDIVSQLYDDGVLFLPDVVIASRAMSDGIEYCKQISGKAPEYKGTVVSYVVEGDIHDIGKKILTVLLRSNGYEVIDLGSDVPIDEVIQAVLKYRPIMLTGTSLMTTTMYSFMEVNDRLLENGINIPFVCGGGAVTQDFVMKYELGIYCEDAAFVPKIADMIIENKGIGELREKFHVH